ncbi:MAG: CHASE2 domain-containing protein [Phormidesmis sp.]
MPTFGRLKSLNQVMPSLLAVISVILLTNIQAWTPLENLVLTQLMRWRGAKPWHSSVVMISIDDKTLAQLGQFPISRDYYADLLWLLTKEEASVVAFNILFSDQGIAGSDLMASSAANSRLAIAMAAHGGVVIGQTWGPEGEPIEPVPVLSRAAIATGHMRLRSDPDGITRTVEVTWQNLSALGVAAVQAYGLDHELVSIPTARETLQINWPGPAHELATLSLIDVLRGQFPQDYFKDKIVIVSYGATTGRAQLRTPFDRQVPVQGGYMQAAVVDNLLSQNWLRSVPNNTVALILFLAAPLFARLLYQRQGLVQIGIISAIAGGWLLICMAALSNSYLLPVVTPLLAIGLVGITATTLGHLQSNALLQVRSAFLNTMSHEIRTPLNAIVNLSEMLQETPLDNRQREFTESLYNSSQSLLALINNVLDFSKIESGRFVLEAYPVSLHEVIERSLEMLAPRAAEKGIELVYSLPPNMPKAIMSDPVRLQQILLNLLSNAVKFTESGEVSVQVHAKAIIQPGALLSPPANIGHWFRTHTRWGSGQRQWHWPLRVKGNFEIRFAVRDTGIGIPPERIGKLFKPFSQVSAATSREYGGTGLGLSISKRLSERMGGDLWVRSALGKGSTFYFTVQAQLAPESTEPGYLARLSGLRLLLIDRNPTRRDRLVWSLQPLGIEVVQAISLSEACFLLKSASAFDGTILDQAVAHDPVQAITQLRETANNASLPVILLSPLKSSDIHLGGNAIILWKPVKQAPLYQALQALRPAALLPVLPADDLAIAAIAQPAKGIAQSRSASLNILIAEDNRTNQRVALRLLELLGYRADVVSSGIEVLAAVRRQHYDVILMDMRMPDLDGIETTRRIRQTGQHTDVWIIAMTANMMAQDRQRCYAAGMNDYLSKPIRRSALARALQICPAMQSS